MYYMFIDESGDHGLGVIDESFPVFVLCGVIISSTEYYHLIDRINQLRAKYWGGKKVILHSSDIRRWRKEFVILFEEEVRSNFISDLNDIISDTQFVIISSAISKHKYIERYGKTGNDVYHLSLSFIIERSVFYLDSLKCDQNEKELKIIIEKRGKKEDSQLATHFHRTRDRGTYYVTPKRLATYNIDIDFKDKMDDISGLQLADLVAYPIATYVIDPDRANPAFNLIKEKFYMSPDKTKLFGFKHFP